MVNLFLFFRISFFSKGERTLRVFKEDLTRLFAAFVFFPISTSFKTPLLSSVKTSSTIPVIPFLIAFLG